MLWTLYPLPFSTSLIFNLAIRPNDNYSLWSDNRFMVHSEKYHDGKELGTYFEHPILH